MSRLSRLKLLTAAVNNGAYGDDAVAAGTPLPILTSNLKITPIEGDTQDRPLDDGVLGNKPVSMIGTHVKATGYIEVAGAGTDTAEPAYHPVLVAAGYESTVGADSVTYSKATPGTEKDVTFYLYLDGVIHKITGARATITTTITVNEIPRREFEITGLYAGHAANATIPAADFSAFQKPAKVGAVQTTFELDSVEYKMLDFTLSDNVQVTYDENTVDERVYITDYNGEGSFVIEAPAQGDFDPIALALAETLLPLALTHGIDEGNTETISIAEVQLMRPEYDDRNGRMTWNIPFRVIGSYDIVTE